MNNNNKIILKRNLPSSLSITNNKVYNNSVIFTKKLNNKYKVIPLKYTNNDLGPNRHFPASTKEWSNSIYTYNINSLKNLSIADKNLSDILTSYFNMYFSKKVLKSKRTATRLRRIDFNKIFVGKAEVKHTNNKALITLYVYNQQKINLMTKLLEAKNNIFPSVKSLTASKNKKYNISNFLQERLLLLTKDQKSLSLIQRLELFCENTITQIKEENLELKEIRSLRLKKEKILFIESLENNLETISNMLGLIKPYYDCDESFRHKCDTYYRDFLREAYLEKEIKYIADYKLLLNLNRAKFEDEFLSILKPLVKRIYNKEIEFNIINLKKMVLDSNIFTNAIAVKLRDRDNRVLRVFKRFLNMVILPTVNRVREKYSIPITNQNWVNRVKNMQINSIVNKYQPNKDCLNELLIDIVPNYITGTKDTIIKPLKETKPYTGLVNFQPENNNNNNNKVNNTTIQALVLNSLKDKNMAGVRLEAKGRLTRRFKASRSLFKVKWKGTLKNIDSSYRGVSSVILRGHVKSNVQYTFANSNNRIGAYGVKGWVSGK